MDIKIRDSYYRQAEELAKFAKCKPDEIIEAAIYNYVSLMVFVPMDERQSMLEALKTHRFSDDSDLSSAD